MYENVKEVDEETIIKGNITSLTRYNTTSLHSDNFEDIGAINTSLIIEAGVTKTIKRRIIVRLLCVSIEWCKVYFSSQTSRKCFLVMITRWMKMFRRFYCWLLDYWKRGEIEIMKQNWWKWWIQNKKCWY